MDVTVEVVPATCGVEDVCRLLNMSRRQFYRLKPWLREQGILVDQVPRIDSRARYQGVAIARFLSADGQAKKGRSELRAVTGGKR